MTGVQSMMLRLFLLCVLLCGAAGGVEPIPDDDIGVIQGDSPEKITPELSREIIAKLTEKYS